MYSRGYMVVNGFLHTHKFTEIYEWLKKAFTDRKVVLDVYANSELVAESLPQDYDFCLFWDKDICLCREIEKTGLPVFNSAKAIDICDNKYLTYEALLDKGILMPKTIRLPFTFDNIGYTNLDFVELYEKCLGYPFVIKETRGSFGMQVYLAHNREEACKLIKEHEGRELIAQEYISECCGQDIRINMVSDKAVTAMERFNKDDFRANITNGGSMRPYTPKKQEVELARHVMKELGLDFAGVDILISNRGPMLCEVNSNAHFKNIFDCTGINVADEIADYIIKRLNLI